MMNVVVVAWTLLSAAVATQAEPPRVNDPISLAASVHRVLGPRLFTISANQIGDDTERLVFVPPPGLALVRGGSSVTITGTVRARATAELVYEWGWTGGASISGANVDNDAMIVADAVVDTETNRVADAAASSTTAAGNGTALTNVSELASSADAGLIGRTVMIRNARINAVVASGGLWLASDTDNLFVLPGDESHVRQGQRVNIRGVVLELPEHMKGRLDDDIAARNEVIYVYATQIRTL
jgi:hypothetical protein